MSEYAVFAAASEALRRILWTDFVDDPVIAPIVGSEAAIVFDNPTRTAQDQSNRLSVWLYQVRENEFLKNGTPVLQEGDGLRFPPLALNLAYLVTPFAPSGPADHLLLGKTMQILKANAVTLLRDSSAGTFEELRVTLAPLTLAELTAVWEALREPYRLSVAYQVRVVRIDSSRVIDAARVVDRVADWRSDPAAVGA
jgi:Pvc16 N-terminal domain